MMCNLGDPMSLRHPVRMSETSILWIHIHVRMPSFAITNCIFVLNDAHICLEWRIWRTLVLNDLIRIQDVPWLVQIHMSWMQVNAEWRIFVLNDAYGVATISRLLKIIGLFCKRDLQKRHQYRFLECKWMLNDAYVYICICACLLLQSRTAYLYWMTHVCLEWRIQHVPWFIHMCDITLRDPLASLY